MRRKWIVVAGAVVAAGALILLLSAVYVLRSDALTERVSAVMSDALNCDVTMDRLDVDLFPRFTVSGANLSIRLRGRPDLPPFVSSSAFEVNLGLLSILRRHVSTVHLDGLQFNVPHRVKDTIQEATRDPSEPAEPKAPERKDRLPFEVDHIVAHNAVVNFVARNPQGRPLLFAISDLEINRAGIGHAMPFHAKLLNPLPEGPVEATGTFGPWDRDDPTNTPLQGDYTLTDADLGTIRGIGGHVTSNGHFTGVLDEIRAEGSSETPDFSLDLGGRPVPLQTTFVVTVDGTDGTTRLDKVDAALGQTHIQVSGIVANLPGPKNHDLSFQASIDKGRIQDMLALFFDSKQPLIQGELSLTGRIGLPPGEGRAASRFDADAEVELNGARFTDPAMQAKVDDLSRKGQGKKKDEDLGRIATDFAGRIKLKHGVLTMSDTLFWVPGARIELNGTYGLLSEQIKLKGEVRLDASLSQAMGGGLKGWFLKPLNPLFRKDGAGVLMPISVEGTRDKPEVKMHIREAIMKHHNP